MARCGCGDSSASAVRSVLSAGNGLTYNSATGVFSACISADAGNNLTFGSDNCLYVPTGTATVSTGPGILGNGSGGSPVRANVATWPFPTAVGTNAQGVYVNGSGQLIGAPAQMVDMTQTQIVRTYPDNPVNTGPGSSPADSFAFTFTNPDPNRSCKVIVTREADVRFTLPGTDLTGPSSAAWTLDLDPVYKYDNPGDIALANIGTQVTSVFEAADLPPGGSAPYTLQIGTLQGAGGATYDRISITLNVLYISI